MKNKRKRIKIIPTKKLMYSTDAKEQMIKPLINHQKTLINGK